MKKPPRPATEPLLTGRRIAVLTMLGIVMAVGTCTVLVNAPRWFPESAGSTNFATTMAFTTFVFYQVFNLLNVRSETGSIFTLRTFTNRAIWVSLVAVVVLQILVVQLSIFAGIFDTVPLTSAQWFLCFAVGATVLVVSEIGKAVQRLSARRRRPGPTPGPKSYQGEGL